MAQNTTIKDIARALGISKSTVSRALADRFDVKPETKKAVMEMAEKMHYRPNPFAQNLIKRRTKIIGVVVPEFINSFLPGSSSRSRRFSNAKAFMCSSPSATNPPRPNGATCNCWKRAWSKAS